MRLPFGMRTKRTQRTGERTVTVTFDIDASTFLAEMERTSEMLAAARHRKRIAHERSVGLAYVGTQLDQMCRDLGLDPVHTWRIPRGNEEREHAYSAAWRVRQCALISLADPGHIRWDGDQA